MLLLPGNAGNLSQRVDYARMFGKLGYSTLLIDYRGYGESTGGPPRERSIYEDAERAWQYLVEERRIPPAHGRRAAATSMDGRWCQPRHG